MSFVISVPQVMASAASDLAGIGSTVSEANFAAAGSTMGVLPAAADEVSTAIAEMFGGHGRAFQMLSSQAAQFHTQFVQALNSAAGTYAAAEGSAVQVFLSAAPGSFLQGIQHAEIALAADISGLAANIGVGLGGSLGGGLSGLGASINAALSGSLNVSGGLSGLLPNGAVLAADLRGGLSSLVQTGASLAGNIGADLSGLAANFGTALTGLSGSLSAGLPGLMASLNAALSGSLGAGLGIGLPTNLGAGLSGLAGILGLNPGIGGSISAWFGGVSAQLNVALSGGLAASLSGIPTQLMNAIAPFGTLLTAGSPAALLAQMQTMELNFNHSLIGAELNFNTSLVANETGLEAAIFGPNVAALNGTVNNIFNFWNGVLGTGELTFDSLLGAQVPVGFGGSLLAGPTSGIVGLGGLSGILGAFDTKFLFDANALTLIPNAIIGNGPLQLALSGALHATGLDVSLNGLLGGSASLQAALTGGPIGVFQDFGGVQLNFSHALIGAETSFNQNLLASELNWETNTFGTNSALNGVVNRVFNVGNLFLDTGEQTVNSLLVGGQAPGLVLTGTGQQVFNGGIIGGFEGIVGQSIAAGADLAGLLFGP